MSLYDWIQTRWTSFRWSGGKKTPYGDLVIPQRLPSLDYTDVKEKTISTTVDCFVTGTYITTGGKIFTIRQRYMVHTNYTRSNVREVMSRIREMVLSKFQEENAGFSISDIFIPPIMTPSDVPEPKYFYKGGRIYRYITKFQEGRFMLKTEKEIYKSRADKIIKKYGLRRREGRVGRI